MLLDQTFPARLPELRRLHETGRLNMAEIGNVLGLAPIDAACRISVAVVGDEYGDGGSRMLLFADQPEPLPETTEHAYRRGYTDAVAHIRYGYPSPELIEFYARVRKWKVHINGVRQPTRTHPPVL